MSDHDGRLLVEVRSLAVVHSLAAPVGSLAEVEDSQVVQDTPVELEVDSQRAE